MGLETASLRDLVEGAASGQLDIPEFQRGFVWRPDQVRALADSLFRDYPIGLILTWENSGYFSPRGSSEGREGKRWLVDGQQRISATCLLFGRKPHWWGDANEWNRQLATTNVLANVCSDTPRLDFGLANPVRASDPRWVSVREILTQSPTDGGSAPEEFLGREASRIAEHLPKETAAKFPVEEIRARLRAIWEIGSRGIAMATVRHGLEDVTEIFTRLNQQGTAVLEADVSLAAASSLHPGWVRDEFLPFSRNLADSGFELEPGVVIRILTGEGLGKTRLDDVPRQFWSSPEFDATWQKTKAALSSVVGSLMGAGVLSSALIPSHNALIPLTVLAARYSSSGFHFRRALHWFLLANRDGRYSGASGTAIAQDIRIVQESNSFAEALESLRGTLSVELRLSPQEFLGRHAWNRPLLLVQYLCMFERKAADWVSRRPLGRERSDTSPDVGFLPYLHPFFPPGRSVLRSVQYDYTDDEVGALANVVLLNQKPTARSWATSPPSKYVVDSDVPLPLLEQQLIPADRALWKPERYRDFLTERSKALANAANRYLASLLGAPG